MGKRIEKAIHPNFTCHYMLASAKRICYILHHIQQGSTSLRLTCSSDATQDTARAQSEEPGPSSAALEGPVLMAINVERTQQGLDTAHKLTVQLLKAHLKGKVIGGQEWKAGNKKREDLMYDYR